MLARDQAHQKSAAAADPNVKIVGTFPENTHPPIIYPVALTKESTNADAQAFLNYLRSPAVRAAFERGTAWPQGLRVTVDAAEAPPSSP